MTSSEIKRAKFGVLLALVCLLIRFFFSAALDQLSDYASYIFEVLCVGIGAWLYRDQLKGKFRLSRPTLILIAIAGVFAMTAGFAIYAYAHMLDIVIPFDLQGMETVLFLLVVAPILEEAIFHGLLWFPLARKNRTLAWVVTAVIFSYSHFFAYFSLPAELHGFVFYQTAYTLLLGLICGLFMWRWNSLIGAMVVHFLFNLGFYLASLHFVGAPALNIIN